MPVLGLKPLENFGWSLNRIFFWIQVIVGSASYISDDPHPPLHEIYRNNESVSPNPRNPLENYTLYSVDMVDGVLCDTIKFKTDKIFLSHNQVR